MHRVVLITGAARNTGFAVARRFAKEGYDVCITSRSAQSAEAAALQVGKEFPDIRTLGLAMEQSNLGQVEAAFSPRPGDVRAAGRIRGQRGGPGGWLPYL